MVQQNDNSVTEINTNTTECTTPTCNTTAEAVNTCTYTGCTCGCDPCQCTQNSLTANPVPYYNQVPGCQEDHTNLIVQQTFTTAISTAVSFNIPACNSSITIVLTGVQNLQIGSYLWNSVYGYLKVTGFDFATSSVTLLNECQANNAAPGTQVPACTLFNVVDPPYEADATCGEGVWVTADYVVPALNASVTVDVTSVAGLIINAHVQVGSDVYLLTAIPTPLTITIKNDGSVSSPVGSTVDAYDVNGNCLLPVSMYTPDLCATTETTPGAIVVCNGQGVLGLLSAEENQVPVCVDPVNNLFEARNACVEELTGTELTACLTLINGTNTYTIVVDDSSMFAEGDVLYIKYIDPGLPGFDTFLWVVTDIPGATSIEIEAVNPPVPDAACIPEGTPVEHACCCIQAMYDLDVHKLEPVCDQDWSTAQNTTFQFVWDADEHDDVLDPGGAAFISDNKEITIVNDTCNVMNISVTADFDFECNFDTNEYSWARIRFEPWAGASTHTVVPNIPPAFAQLQVRTLAQDVVFGIGPTPCASFNSRYYTQYHHTEIISLAAHHIVRFEAHMEVYLVNYKAGSLSCCNCPSLGTEGTGVATVTAANTFLHAIGVAVQVS